MHDDSATGSSHNFGLNKFRTPPGYVLNQEYVDNGVEDDEVFLSESSIFHDRFSFFNAHLSSTYFLNFENFEGNENEKLENPSFNFIRNWIYQICAQNTTLHTYFVRYLK